MEVHFHLYIRQFYDAGIIVIRGTEVCLNQGAPDLVYELKYVFYGQQTYSIEIPRNIVAIYPIRLYPLISAHCA